MASTSMLHNSDDTSRPTRTFTYSSRPRAVPNRLKYRRAQEANDEDGGQTHYGNLMYDRRVVRGNTYSLDTLPWGTEPDAAEIQKIQKHREVHRKMLARKRAKEEQEARAPEITDTGSRVNVQTELYLEEIAERIFEVDTECQTDYFVDRPKTPIYIPSKIGKDASTQIEEGELFDFDLEVKPMLQVLVGKTIEQALLEVSEEEVIANLRAHQCAYIELRNAEKAEVQRLEEQERRHKVEKTTRMEKEKEAQRQMEAMKEKVAAQAFAGHYLTDVIPSALSNLQDHGYFYDSVERDIEKGFLPDLMKNTERCMEKRMLGRIMADSLIGEVASKRLESYDEDQKPLGRKKALKARQQSPVSS